MTEEPDVSEAVERVIRMGYDKGWWSSDADIAKAAIAAYREALAKAGYTVAPVVKMSHKDFDGLWSALGKSQGNQAACDYLRSLGLPIKLEDE